MNNNENKRVRAGDSLEDVCRVCKTGRSHTVIVADNEGQPLRVICDYCGSQHNYRGGEKVRPDRQAISSVTERERSFPTMSHKPEEGSSGVDLEMMLRRIIREEAGLTPVSMADKWNGGSLVLKPGRPELQEKAWPIETFFHKIVMLRNRLRVLEQQINGADIPEEMKIKLQGYITGCYGTLTSFNVLFASEEDRFHGSTE